MAAISKTHIQKGQCNHVIGEGYYYQIRLTACVYEVVISFCEPKSFNYRFVYTFWIPTVFLHTTQLRGTTLDAC